MSSKQTCSNIYLLNNSFRDLISPSVCSWLHILTDESVDAEMMPDSSCPPLIRHWDGDGCHRIHCLLVPSKNAGNFPLKIQTSLIFHVAELALSEYYMYVSACKQILLENLFLEPTWLLLNLVSETFWTHMYLKTFLRFLKFPSSWRNSGMYMYHLHGLFFFLHNGSNWHFLNSVSEGANKWQLKVLRLVWEIGSCIQAGVI